MEHYKITKVLNDLAVVSKKFVTEKWIKVNDLSYGEYSGNNNIRFKNSMPRSTLWEYSDTYIVIKGRISVAGKMLTKEITS